METKKIINFFKVALGLVLLGVIAWRVVLIVKYGSLSSKPPVEETSLGTVTDFNLTERNGSPFGLKDLKDKVWVADFIFTRCKGPCPLVTFKMAGLQKDFQGQPDLKFVSFSVDPEYDTPFYLTKYADTFNAEKNRWYFLTGDKKQIYDLIRNSFHLAVDQPTDQPIQDSDIIHSLSFVLIDREGKIRGYFNSTEDEAILKLKEKIKELLK